MSIIGPLGRINSVSQHCTKIIILLLHLHYGLPLYASHHSIRFSVAHFLFHEVKPLGWASVNRLIVLTLLSQRCFFAVKLSAPLRQQVQGKSHSAD